MKQWGPHGRQGVVAFSFDNVGEAGELEFGLWPKNKRVGFHPSIYETLPFLLDTLAEHRMKATFFVEAWNVEHYPDAVRAIAAEGHEIGSHGYRHESWFKLTDEQQIATLKKAHDLFASVGVNIRGFRPPSGISMPATEAAFEQFGYIYVSPVGGQPGVRNGVAVIPSEMHGTDVSYYSKTFKKFRHPLATGTEGQAFARGFELMLDRIAESGDCRSPVSHVTTPLDTQERRDTFRRIVEMAAKDDRLWKPTIAEAAEWMLRNASALPQPPLRSFHPEWDPRTFVHEEEEA